MKKQKDRGVPVKGPIVTEIFPVRDNKDVDEEDNDDDDDESKGDQSPLLRLRNTNDSKQPPSWITEVFR